MDVGEVEHIAAQLELEVNAINAVVSVIDRGVSALAGVWMGDDVAAFSGLWHQSHRPRAQSVADSLSTWVTQLREQARDQTHTSGGRGHHGGHHTGWLDSLLDAGGGVLGLGSLAQILGQSFVKAWELTSPLRTGESVFETLTAIKRFGQDFSRYDELIGNSTIKGLGTSLGLIGAFMDGATLGSGIAENDGGKMATGAIGGALDVAGTFPPALPVVVWGQITLELGSHILPVNNEEYAGTYDQALADHFGSAYDPANPTSEQAQWGMDHYSGAGGFFNSIGDGVKYKFRNHFGLW